METKDEMKTKIKEKNSSAKNRYPLGGMGLSKKEDEKMELMLAEAGISLKFLQRNFARQWMAGKIKLEI